LAGVRRRPGRRSTPEAASRPRAAWRRTTSRSGTARAGRPSAAGRTTGHALRCTTTAAGRRSTPEALHDRGRRAANRIAKWDGSSWSALGSGMDGTSYVMPWRCTTTARAGALRRRLLHERGRRGGELIAKWDGSNWSAARQRDGGRRPASSPGGVRRRRRAGALRREAPSRSRAAWRRTASRSGTARAGRRLGSGSATTTASPLANPGGVRRRERAGALRRRAFRTAGGVEAVGSRSGTARAGRHQRRGHARLGDSSPWRRSTTAAGRRSMREVGSARGRRGGKRNREVERLELVAPRKRRQRVGLASRPRGARRRQRAGALRRRRFARRATSWRNGSRSGNGSSWSALGSGIHATGL
jgi:hypothetical protein